MGVGIAIVMWTLFTACENSAQEEIIQSESELVESVNKLKKYANQHNSGLDYIKRDAEKFSGVYTVSRLDSVFEKYVAMNFEGKEMDEVLGRIAAMKAKLYVGNIPTLQSIGRGNDELMSSVDGNCALVALEECMSKISECIEANGDEILFDNERLLGEFHDVINRTYVSYTKECSNEEERNILCQTLGVLYGSIEYWSNSENVASWGNIDFEDLSNGNSKPRREKGASAGEGSSVDVNKDNNSNENSNSDKTLSKSDYIMTIAAADAIGGYISGPGAIIASAGAALYFEVE